MAAKLVERFVDDYFFYYQLTCPFQERLPFLDTGIVEILARATGGIGIVLEHRYYGTYTVV